MKALIIDDSEYKVGHIRSYLEDLGFDEIEVRTCLREGLNRIDEGIDFDLMILDMTMPFYATDVVEKEAGLFIVRRLAHKKVKVDIIICSSDLVEYMEIDTIGNVLGQVQFDSSIYQLPDFKDLLESKTKKE